MVVKHRFLFSIMYDGSDYFGLVKQPNKKTILGVMEECFFHTFNEKVLLVPAGRTDAGVHAYDQKILMSTSIIEDKLVKYWNRSLPASIHINDCIKVENEKFHVRFSVVNKTYLYKLTYQDKIHPFNARFISKIRRDFSLNIFQQALQIFVGTHDFYSVCTYEPNVKTIKTINSITIKEKDNEIQVFIVGKSFLRHMVRRIIGSAIACAEKVMEIDELENCFNNKIKMKYKASSNGLYLLKVMY